MQDCFVNNRNSTKYTQTVFKLFFKLRDFYKQIDKYCIKKFILKDFKISAAYFKLNNILFQV